jgi:hypothetical protein
MAADGAAMLTRIDSLTPKTYAPIIQATISLHTRNLKRSVRVQSQVRAVNIHLRAPRTPPPR